MTNHSTKDLQQLLSELDAQIAINISISGRSCTIAQVVEAIERQGFIRHPDDQWFTMSNGDGYDLFTLQTPGGVLGTPLILSLVMDVPCVSPEKSPFQTMTTCARNLALQLGGALVDDDHKPLSDTTLKSVEKQVADFHKHMEAAGLVPGSTLARRLFSL